MWHRAIPWTEEARRVLGSGPEVADLKRQLVAVSTARRDTPGRLHLAILREPFLGYILDGSKTVESRFSRRRVAPYGSVSPGDLLVLKAASGPLVAVCIVKCAWFREVAGSSCFKRLKKEFGKRLRDDVPDFWEQRTEARYVTLLEVDRVRVLPAPIRIPKRDRRPWVVFDSTTTQLELPRP